MSNTFLFPITSVESVNFTEALAESGAAKSAMNNIKGFPAKGPNWWLIRAITAITKENYGPELNFFSSAAGLTTDPGTDQWLGRYGFTSAMGEQLADSGLWRYYVNLGDDAIPYVDYDTVDTFTTPSLHVVMQNISSTVAKSSGANGDTVITFWVNQMQSF